MMGIACAFGKPLGVLADGMSGNEIPEERKINDDDRKVAYSQLLEYLEVLRIKYQLSDLAEEKVAAIIHQANTYIRKANITPTELDAYVAGVKSDMAEVVGQGSIYGSSSKFLYLSNEIPVTAGKYGEPTRLILSVINLGQENVSNLVITPNVSTELEKWPFVIQTASDVRTIPQVKAAPSAYQAFDYRMDIYWDLIVRPDAKTGVYPVSFHVQYYRNNALEETDLTTYINIEGAPGRGSLEEEKKDEPETKSPMPRIIVTGFKTNPEKVMAGDDFTLTITVQNTSTMTAVSNVQFDITADAVAAGSGDGAYAAFLPTSGSSTVYVPRIEAGQTTDISIDMTARNDLSQKPYIVKLSAEYEDAKANMYKADADVSVPIYQEARMQISNLEIAPPSAEVGSSVNIMFDINNMGRTTLYNTQVHFESETLSGGDVFLGTLESGKTGAIDTMVDCIAPTMDDGTVKVVVTYEDDAGNQNSYEQDINIFVFEGMDYGDEGMWDEGGMWGEDMYGGFTEDTGKKFPIWIPIAGVGGVGAIVGIVCGVKASKKKKAKRLAELADEDL